MHKLIKYVCEELESLEKKADKGGLSSSEIQYADTLAHLKKNLLKSEELYDEVMIDGEYSGASRRMMSRGTASYARGRNAKRDSMGRYSRDEYGYSRAAEDVSMRLRDMMHDAPDEQTRKDIERIANRIDGMM